MITTVLLGMNDFGIKELHKSQIRNSLLITTTFHV